MDEDRVPAVDRGPTRPLSERAARMAARAALTDRSARFESRFEEVTRVETRRRRRAQLLDPLAILAILVGAPLAGWWVAALVGVPAGTGIAVGIPVGVGLVLLRRWSHRYASGRGATAWDWQRRRYVVRGDPSRGVQQRTGRDAGDGGPAGRWGGPGGH